MAPTSDICSEKTGDMIEKTMRVKFAVKMTNMIIRKFQTMTIKDDIEPPFKKAKLLFDEKDNNNRTTKNEIHCPTPYPTAVRRYVSVLNDDQVDVLSSKKMRRKCISSLKMDKCRNPDRSKMRANSKHKSKHRKSTKFCHLNANYSPYVKRSPIASARHLSALFERCVNFSLSSRSEVVKDIDMIVRKFSTYGAVSKIQDHWTRKKGSASSWSSFWTGALVTFKDLVNLSKIFKDSFIAGDSTVVPIYVPLHLSRIGRIESQLSTEEVKQGTEILVEGLSMKTSRYKVREELDKYGTVLYVLWDKEQNPNWMSLIVAYRYTVEAFAAALALDGRSFCRSILHAKMKISRKEWKIHYELCATYS